MHASEAWKDVAKQQSFTRRRFQATTYCLAALCAGATLALYSYPLLAVALISIVCGWCELDGLCGSSHAATITPMRHQSRAMWRGAAFGYLVGGVVTGGLVGAGLGEIGTFFQLQQPLTFSVMAVLATALAAREFGWWSFRLPQIHRQTCSVWASEFGAVCASTMWGAHIGLGFVTVIRHGGFFVVALNAAAWGPLYGAALFACYWIGRALPVVAGPWLAVNPKEGGSIVLQIQEASLAFSRTAGVALLCFCLIAVTAGIRAAS